MKRLFSRLFSRESSMSHGSSRPEEQRNEGFSISQTAGSTSKATILVNDTDKTLLFRDKVGAAIGGTRYKILPHSRIEVTPLQHTFFKLLAYAIVEEEQGGRKKGIDTRLSIDSDQLADNRCIYITLDGSNYKLNLSSR